MKTVDLVKDSEPKVDQYNLPLNTKYAGFWVRYFAFIIDKIVLLLVFILFVILVQKIPAFVSFVPLSIFICIWLYFTLMESSRNQATLGKMVMRIRVTDYSGNKISLGKANLRFFSKIFSCVILLIGFFMIAFTEKKQGLHDLMAGTYLIRKNAI